MIVSENRLFCLQDACHCGLYIEIQSAVYRAARAVVDGKISGDDAVERLRQCGERIQSLPSVLGDAFTILGELFKVCPLEDSCRARVPKSVYLFESESDNYNYQLH